MSDNIKIELRGLDKLLEALHKFPRETEQTIRAAGEEVSNEILDVQGLRKYPPLTAANRPPTPFYIRGKGVQYKSYLKPTSERLGTQWFVKSERLKTYIGNRASYAPYVHGENDQNMYLAVIGWKKLIEVAKEKAPAIQRIYQAWIDRLITKLGL